VKLSELAAGVPGAVVEAGGEAEITGIVFDSRKARRGELFVAVGGLTVDGHLFAADAAAMGAAVAIQKPVALPAGTPVLRLADSRTGLAELAAEFYGRPARRLRVAGVTGTDGKTTTTHMAAHVLGVGGRRAGFLSTVAFQVGGPPAENSSGQTTTESPEVQAALARMLANGLDTAVIEVTSHALVQQRVAACEFDVAAFTNVGRDHLDYHRSWSDYVEAKARLIELCSAGADKGVEKTAVLNADDASHERLSTRPIARRWSYAIDADAELRAHHVELGRHGSAFLLSTPLGDTDVHLHVPARFNVYNALCAAGICLALGLTPSQVADGLGSFAGVQGRLEAVELGQPFRVFIDFAHSAGSLAAALAELRPFAERRLIVVFGSTARSDHDRPGMGRAAALGSDFFIITSDDPVNEDPAEIAREVQEGALQAGRAPVRDFDVIVDRRQAIRRAIEIAQPGDVVLLAGKGHEHSMITAGGKEPWDERAEAEAALRDLPQPS
jgi:UDP-N-acetylmuramoyl-L-alanyl-D-glutamate--2,6-diaminopimelate ligase